jgi:transcription elongation factor Elf1
MAKEYFQKLKDPRWQKKRLEILSRDNFTCRHCGDKESALHVHHGYYRWQTNPWEYEDNSLMTLCGKCHEFIEYSRKDIIHMIGFLSFDELMKWETEILVKTEGLYERMYPNG